MCYFDLSDLTKSNDVACREKLKTDFHEISTSSWNYYQEVEGYLPPSEKNNSEK